MRRYLVFATASLGLLMYAIDSTVVAVAFPHIVRDLGTNLLWAGWTISIYYIGVTTAMPLAGNLSDSFGRKKVFVISLIIFTVSSLVCGLAPNIYMLIVFRFLQGIGGASFLPTASGIATDHFPEDRERVIGLLSSVFNAGSIIGPNLGGWIVSRYSWRYVFYINLPIGVGLIALMMVLLNTPKISSRPHVDIAGASYFSGSILFLMFGLNLIGESFAFHSLLSAGILLSLSFSCVLLFLRQEKKESKPILDTVLLKSKPFLAANLLNMIVGAGFFGLFATVPLYATSVYKLSTLVSGMILTPRSLGVIFASVATSFLLKRWGYRQPLVLGLAIVSCATILLAPGLPLLRIMAFRWGIIETLAFLILFCGIGAGIVNPAANNACIELMPEKVATIVGLRGMFRTVGGALGISLITFILHLSSNPLNGFSFIFIFFGLALSCVIPLAFMLPTGKKEWGHRLARKEEVT
jgi:EmrB/QacA subfamily drug resistance transporter